MNRIPLGVDISKATFDVSLEVGGKVKHSKFDNMQVGYAKCLKWARDLYLGEQHFHVCMEATGAHWCGLAEFCHAAGQTVSVVNPARIKGHAQSQALRHKTDKQDAEVIRHYCATQSPPAWTPPSPEIKALREMVRRRDDLTQHMTSETNRAKSGAYTGEALASVARSREFIKQELKQVAKAIKELVKAHAKLAHSVKLMRSVKGLGFDTAVRLIAEVTNLDKMTDANALAASLGVTPVQRESGTSIKARPRMSKQGNSTVRAALWWPAIKAMDINPIVRAMADRLRKKHKPRMVIIIACMHKLLNLACGVLRTQQPFDPDWHRATH